MTPYQWQTRPDFARLLGITDAAVVKGIKRGRIETRAMTTKEREAATLERKRAGIRGRGAVELVRLRADLNAVTLHPGDLLTFKTATVRDFTDYVEDLARRCFPDKPNVRVVVHLDGEPTEVKPVAPALGDDDVRRLQAALSEASRWIGNIKGASVVERDLVAEVDQLRAELKRYTDVYGDPDAPVNAANFGVGKPDVPSLTGVAAAAQLRIDAMLRGEEPPSWRDALKQPNDEEA